MRLVTIGNCEVEIYNLVQALALVIALLLFS